MMGRYRGRHRAGDSPNDIPTKPFPPIDTAGSIRQGLLSAETAEIPETNPWVFEGAAVPPYVGTHIAMHCNLCNHVAWTYRNTEQGWAELRRRINEHKEVHT